jgi:pimeloyl-ACP methyl ester carboxylesterase
MASLLNRKNTFSAGQDTSQMRRWYSTGALYVTPPLNSWSLTDCRTKSYGTILGATLSAIYPQRIKRAVLDGVADSHDYMAGGWTTNLQDTDLLFAKLAEYCYEGGPENCAIFDDDGPAVIVANLQNTVARFKDNPIAIPGNKTSGPQVVMYNDLKLLFRDIVYHALLYFPLTAQILHELSIGSGASLAAWKSEQQPSLGTPLSPKCHKDGPYSPPCFTNQRIWDATAGIACSDGLPKLNQTKAEYREYANKIMAQSNLIGAFWAEIQMPCTAWHARPHWRYDGDFHNETAHPILFAGNTIDPVTPLRNAFTMASGFEGAGILHLDAEGHCTYASPSMCAGRAIREYFQSGKLPGKERGLEDLDDWSGYGALCEVDRSPFDGYRKGDVPPLPDGETDEELWKALVHLNQNWP